MIQKKIITGFIILFFAAALPVFAKDLLSAGDNNLGAEETMGTPVEEIISAAQGGGLSASKDLSLLLPTNNKQGFEGAITSENSTPTPDPALAGFKSDSLKQLELQGGLSSAPQISADTTPSAFKMAVKFFEEVVFKKDVEFAGRPKFDKGLDISSTPTFDKDTAGYAMIMEGNQSVEVDFDHEYDAPPVVTATLSLQQYKDSDVRAVAEDLLLISDVKYIITNVSKKSFEIMMDRKADSDIPFSWHALAVDNPGTAKKSGENSNSGIANDSGGNNASAGPAANRRKTPAAPGPAAVGQSEISKITNDPGASGNQNPN